LDFTTDIADAAEARVHFVCVGTPQKPGEFAADVTYVDAAVDALLPHLQPGAVVVGKSTVPVGTAGRLAGLVEPAGGVLMWNPEFLREGHAVEDTLHPNRLVYGVADGQAGQTATEALDEVYASMLEADTPRLVADFATAELVKTAANSFLAPQISFINAMSELFETSGADVTLLADAIWMD
ncbi:UDP-glucose 6-dehydrogenase, partial [Burkholderia multivorans]